MSERVLTGRDIPGNVNPETGEKQLGSHNDSDEIIAQEKEATKQRIEKEERRRQELAGKCK